MSNAYKSLATSIGKATAPGQTSLNFTREEDIWPAVEAWAKSARLVLEEHSTVRRCYRLGSILTCPVYVEIVQEGAQVYINAWVQRHVSVTPALTPLLAHLLPPQMPLRSGGLVAALPRAQGRRVLNQLLTTLKQAPIA